MVLWRDSYLHRNGSIPYLEQGHYEETVSVPTSPVSPAFTSALSEGADPLDDNEDEPLSDTEILPNSTLNVIERSKSEPPETTSTEHSMAVGGSGLKSPPPTSSSWVQWWRRTDKVSSSTGSNTPSSDGRDVGRGGGRPGLQGTYSAPTPIPRGGGRVKEQQSGGSRFGLGLGLERSLESGSAPVLSMPTQQDLAPEITASIANNINVQAKGKEGIELDKEIAIGKDTSETGKKKEKKYAKTLRLTSDQLVSTPFLRFLNLFLFYQLTLTNFLSLYRNLFHSNPAPTPSHFRSLSPASSRVPLEYFFGRVRI